MNSDHAQNMGEVLIKGETLNSEGTMGQSIPAGEMDGPQKVPKEKAGVILKRIRKAQNLSLEIVHEATKIPLDALRAIEEGYTIRIISSFYYKGFLKIYADYLGIDASEVIEDYKQEELPKHIEHNMEEFEIPKGINDFFTQERKKQIVVAAGIILALFFFFTITKFFIRRGSHPDGKKNVGTKVIENKRVRGKSVKKKAGTVYRKARKNAPQQKPNIASLKVISEIEAKRILAASKPVSSPSAAVQKNITLTVRAKRNSWLRVRTDGNIVFQSTLRLGSVETWNADEEIEIAGKNINQLEFEMNGKMIGTLGRKDRNAKKVVITKNGLSVKN